MTNEDLPRYKKIMAITGEIYSKEITPLLTEGMHFLLKDYDISDIEKAFYEHMKESTFFPTPAEIIERLPIQKHYITDEEIDGYLK